MKLVTQEGGHDAHRLVCRIEHAYAGWKNVWLAVLNMRPRIAALRTRTRTLRQYCDV